MTSLWYSNSRLPGFLSYCRYVLRRARRLGSVWKIKAAFCSFVQQRQGCADLPSVYATASGCPTARESESCLFWRTGSWWTWISTEDALTPAPTQPSTHSTGGKKPLECIFLRGHWEGDMTKWIKVSGKWSLFPICIQDVCMCDYVVPQGRVPYSLTLH